MRILLLIIIGSLAACGNETGAPLMATDIDVTTPMPGVSMSAAYLTLTNNSDEPTRISSISSPQYERIEIHKTTIEDGVARMRKVDELIIQPDDSIRLQRGGIHLMMIRPVEDIDMITLNLYDGDLLLMSLRTSRADSGN